MDAVLGGDWGRLPDRCILDGVHVPQEKGRFCGFFNSTGLNGVLSVFLKQKCICLVREKLMMFPHGQDTNGIVIYSFFFVTRSKLVFTRNLLKCNSR